MPDQQEELKLVVTLVDNASAGLASIKSAASNLIDNQATDKIRRYKREQDDLNKSLKDMVSTVAGGQQSMLGLVAGYGALGAAVAATTGVILNYSKSLAAISRQGKVMGFDPAEFKNMQEQLLKVGMSSDQAGKNLTGLARAMVDLSHTGSRSWNTLIEMARQHAGEMAQTIQRIENAQNLTEAFNTAQEAARNVYQNRLIENQEKVKRGIMSQYVSIMDANAAANKFMNTLGLDPTTRLLFSLKELSQAQHERNQRILEDSLKVEEATQELTLSVIDLKDQFVLAFGPGLAQLLESTSTDIRGIVWLLDEVDKLLHKIGASGDVGDMATKLGAAKLHDILTHPMQQPGENQQAPWTGLAPQFQHGTSRVGRAGLAYLHRDEAVVPSGSVSQDEHERKEQTDELNKNLKTLNETLYDMLNMQDIDDADARNRRYKFLGGVGVGPGGGGGGGGGPGGGGGGGGRGGGGTGPNGSDVGPGSGQGAGETSALSPTAGGQGLAGLPSRGVVGDPNAGMFGTPSMGTLSSGVGGATSIGGAGSYSQADRMNKSIPASLRYNNPGAQWPHAQSKDYGMTDVGVIGGNNKIAGFPTIVHGAASNIDLLQRNYVGKTIGHAIWEWSGHNRNQVPGFNPNTVITPELARDPNFLHPFMREMSQAESGRKGTLSDEQIDQAIKMVQMGGAKAYEAAIAPAGGVSVLKTTQGTPHNNPTAATATNAAGYAGTGNVQPGAPTAPGAMQSATGAPQAIVIHHTGPGIHTPEQLLDVLHQRGGLGVEFTADEKGNVIQVGSPGAQNIKDERSKYGTDLGRKLALNNSNIIGIEVMASGDKAVNEAQVAAVKAWIAKNYPDTPVYGHGEIQKDKEADEGRKIVTAIRQGRAAMDKPTTVAVNGSGQVEVKVKTTPEAGKGDSVLKDVPVTRQAQMQPAEGAAGQELGY